MINTMLEPPKKVFKDIFSFSFLKVAILFFVIMLLAWAGYRAWKDKEQDTSVEDFSKRYGDYVAIYKNDTYGGKTPKETLDLFITALEKNDPELATLYFMPDDNGSRKKIQVLVEKAYKAGKFPALAASLKKAKPEEDGIIGENFYEYVARDKDGRVLVDIHLIFNGNIWKVDNI